MTLRRDGQPSAQREPGSAEPLRCLMSGADLPMMKPCSNPIRTLERCRATSPSCRRISRCAGCSTTGRSSAPPGSSWWVDTIGDVPRSAERSAALAHQLRARFSDVIAWVPFVDAILVADHEETGLAATVIELDMLVFALTSGGRSIDGTRLSQLQHFVPRVIHSMASTRRSPRPLDPA